jgi:hypothetical protein
MSAPKSCEKSVSDHTGLHWWPCAKPAKFRVTNTGGKDYHVCGIHARRIRLQIESGRSARELTPLA